MMEPTKPFTEEATAVMDSYLSEVSKALSATELTQEEVDGSIDELRAHILDHCELKSKGEFITTDQVRDSIKKLGDPKTIANTLQSELDVSATIQSELSGDETSSDSDSTTATSRPSGQFQIRASHLTALYGLFSWAITATIIFVLYSETFEPYADLIPFAYISAAGLLILTRNVDAYSYNRHLQKYIRPNFHTNISPVLFVFLATSVFGSVISEWVIPAIIVLWLLLSTTEYGRQYYFDTFQKTKHYIEQSRNLRAN